MGDFKEEQEITPAPKKREKIELFKIETDMDKDPSFAIEHNAPVYQKPVPEFVSQDFEFEW